MLSKYIQLAFAAILFLNLTNLFVFASTWFGFSLQALGALMTAGAGIYLFIERGTLSVVMQRRVAWVVILLFFVWPVVYLAAPVFQGYSMRRELALQFFYIFMTLGSAVFVIKNGYSRARWVVLAAFSFTLFGLFLETFFPGFFYSVAVRAEDTSESFQAGRAGGFFINPNNAGRFTILMYLFAVMSPRPMKAWVLLLLSAAVMVAVFFTASRSSILIGSVVVTMVISLRFAFPYLRQRFEVRPERIALGMASLAIVGAITVLAIPTLGRYIINNTELASTGKTAERIEFFTTGVDGFTEGLTTEALGRWYTVEPYVPAFKESWMFGRGAAGYRIYRTENLIPLTPHNTIFALWIDYGILYILALFTFAGYFIFSRGTRLAEQHVGLVYSIVFAACVFGICFTFDSLMTQRPTYIVMGLLLGLSVAPNGWFNHDRRLSEQPFFSLFTQQPRRRR